MERRRGGEKERRRGGEKERRRGGVRSVVWRVFPYFISVNLKS
jgi:hypothetical protein